MGQGLLTEAMVHSETARGDIDMEQTIENELSLHDLETVIGGAKTREYDMNGDHFVCTRDGCTNTSTPPQGSSLWTWLKAIF